MTDPLYVVALASLDQQIASLDTPEGEAEVRTLMHQLADELPVQWLAIQLEGLRAVIEQAINPQEAAT